MFGPLSGIRTYLYVGLGVAVALAIGAAAWYWHYSQNKIQELIAQNAVLTVAVDEQKKTINAMREFQAKQAKDIGDLQTNLSASEERRARLEAIFARHDMNALARKDPKAIEQRMNRASERMVKELSGGGR